MSTIQDQADARVCLNEQLQHSLEKPLVHLANFFHMERLCLFIYVDDSILSFELKGGVIHKTVSYFTENGGDSLLDRNADEGEVQAFPMQGKNQTIGHLKVCQEDLSQLSETDLSALEQFIDLLSSHVQISINDVPSSVGYHILDNYFHTNSIASMILNKHFSIELMNEKAKRLIYYITSESEKDLSEIIKPNLTKIIKENIPYKFHSENIEYTVVKRRFKSNDYYYITFNSDKLEQKLAFMKKCQSLDLSEREVDIVLLILRGFTNKQIAEALFISINTVKTHVKNIFSKLNVNNRTALAYLFSEYDFSE